MEFIEFNEVVVDERPKRLLIVIDGRPAHLFYTNILLQRLGYRIHAVKTAEDALEIMHTADPSLVLTEASLTGMTGVDLLKKIRQDPKTAEVPVIVLTSLKDQAVKSACLQVGCAAYLLKPVEPDVLYAAIQKETKDTRQFIRLKTKLNVTVGDEAAATSLIDDYVTALSEQACSSAP